MKLPPKGSHSRDLYEYLAEGNKITMLEYYERFRRFDLAQRIYDLQKKYDIKIHRDMIRKGRAQYAIYWIER